MNPRRSLTWIARVAAILLLAAPGSSSAQTAADLFDDSTLQTLHLAVHSRDWDQLRANFTTNDYYPADLTWNGIRVRNAGVRSRGYGSRSPDKPGLELDFARYSFRGEFLGLRSLVLDNLITDPSMIRERVAMAFLRRFGVPAPREAHARVFINGEYAGVYTIVEPVDPAFVQRTLGDAQGTLFEFRWTSPYYGDYLGPDLDLYRPMFEPRSHEDDSTFDLYDPVRELFRVITEAPGDTFAEEVAPLLDLDSTVTLVAAEAFLGEIDGILGFAGMNNVYLHRHSATGQHRFLPWDKDHTFLQWSYPVLTGAAHNALMRRVLEDPELRSLYFSRLLEAAASASDSDWLAREIQTAYEQIRDAALADPLKPYTSEEFEEGVAALVEFARDRPSFVAQDVQQLQTQ